MNKEALINIINFWQKAADKEHLFPRLLLNAINLKGDEIIDLVGPRRSGKSSLLYLIINQIKSKGNYLFINFEDPFFIENNGPQVIEELIDVYKEYYNPKLKYLFFDEMQNIKDWEKAIRKLGDGTNYKIFITGSSSKLLSRELSSLITGRHLSFELWPLKFKEYLLFKGLSIDSYRDFAQQKTKISRYFNKYMKLGGFPKIVLKENEELLKQYYLDILEKDIIKHYDIRHKQIIEKLGVYLLSQAGKLLSIASIQKTFWISFEIASNYIDYFKEAFLVFELPQFSYSLKTQQKAQKKIFAVDTGLANAVSFRFSEDKGRIFENTVFIHLKQMYSELYYYKTKNNLEVDFLCKQSKKVELIQACFDLYDEKTKAREISALVEAMKELKLSSGIILTNSTKDTIKIKGATIHVFPAFEWFLFNSEKQLKD